MPDPKNPDERRTWMEAGAPEGDDLGVPSGQRYVDAVEVGRGGMGRVLRARDQRLRRQVAYKELSPPGGKASRGWVERFTHEAAITAQLEHPGIVPVYDAGTTEEGRHFYTMRFIRGRSLAALLAERPAPAERLLEHLRDACQAVAYAHSKGVVHRDLKPENIMIGDFGETQIVDWGIAKVIGDPESTGELAVEGTPKDQTAAGAVIGTPRLEAVDRGTGATIGQPENLRLDVVSTDPLGRLAVSYGSKAGITDHGHASRLWTACPNANGSVLTLAGEELLVWCSISRDLHSLDIQTGRSRPVDSELGSEVVFTLARAGSASVAAMEGGRLRILDAGLAGGGLPGGRRALALRRE